MKNRLIGIFILTVIAATLAFAGGGNNVIEFSQNNLSLQTQINNGVLSIATETIGRVASDAEIIATQALHAGKLDPVTAVASTTALSTEESNRIASDAALASYAQSIAAPGSLLYYYQEADSGVTIDNATCPAWLATGSFELFATTSAASVTVEAHAPLTNTAWILEDQWITPAGKPNITTLLAAAYANKMYVFKDSGNDVQVVFELWGADLVNSVSTTLVATSDIFLITADNATTTVNTVFTTNEDIRLSATDQGMIKMYARKVGSGGNTSLTTCYGGGYSGFFTLLISARSFARTDLSNLTSNALVNAGIASTAQLASETSERLASDALRIAKAGDTMTGTLAANNGLTNSPAHTFTSKPGSVNQTTTIYQVGDSDWPYVIWYAPNGAGSTNNLLRFYYNALCMGADNAYDIGSAAGALLRPRDIYAARNINASGALRILGRSYFGPYTSGSLFGFQSVAGDFHAQEALRSGGADMDGGGAHNGELYLYDTSGSIKTKLAVGANSGVSLDSFNFGVGTSTPDTKFTVIGNASISLGLHVAGTASVAGDINASGTIRAVNATFSTPLPITSGGTGQTASSAALDALGGVHKEVSALWTPRFHGSVNRGDDTTYSAQYGIRTRIGSVVTWSARVTVNSKGSLSGSIYMDLPFTATSTSEIRQAASVAYFNKINLSVGYSHVGLYLDAGTSTALLVQSGDNADVLSIDDTMLDTNSSFVFSGSFVTNE